MMIVARTPPPLQKLPSLFAAFMAKKVKTYVEPLKKGTPRGDPIGFSLVKYRATLYALRERVLPGKRDFVTQAKELGISYGVIRKWWSEQKFRDMVDQHEKEFLRYVVGARGVLKPGMHPLGARSNVLRVRMAERPSETTKDALTKLLILIHGNVPSDLLKSNLNPNTLRECQLLALNSAIAILKDRRATPKHRKAIINLLSGVRESLE
jgi:hypothetical protein